MASYEISRTLVKSPPELWEELQGDRWADAMGEVSVRPTEPDRELAWEADGARGTAVIEPSGWGTKVTLTAEVEEQVAAVGFWSRFRASYQPPVPPRHPDMEAKLEHVLDSLGHAHRRPFSRG